MELVERGFVNAEGNTATCEGCGTQLIMLHNEDSMQVTLYCGDSGTGGSLDGLGMCLQNGECNEFVLISHEIYKRFCGADSLKRTSSSENAVLFKAGNFITYFNTHYLKYQ